MSEMRDDLLATLGAAQEGADKSALADAFCDRWQKEARKERRITPPPWGGWFEFFGWSWVILIFAGIVMATVAAQTFRGHNVPLNIAAAASFVVALMCFCKWISEGDI